jgi:hypothetical protein
MEAELNKFLYVERLNPVDKAVFEQERSAMTAALKVFGGSHPEGSREYVRGVLRVVDGKAVFKRVMFKLKPKVPDAVVKRTMASHMAHEAPAEMISHIESFKAAAVVAPASVPTTGVVGPAAVKP